MEVTATSPESESSLQPGRTAAAAEAGLLVTHHHPGEDDEDDFRTKGEAQEVQAKRGANSFVRAVGESLKLCGLCPSTTYRVTLEVPLLVRDDLLESAR